MPVVPPTAKEVAREAAAAAKQRVHDRQERAVLNGGEEHVVTLRRRRESLANSPKPELAGDAVTDSPEERKIVSESVTVPLISVRKYQEFFLKQNDEIALIALVCDRPPEWVESLTPASHAILIDAVLALNFPWVIAWADRQSVVTENLMPGGSAVASSPSPNSARAPQSSSAAA